MMSKHASNRLQQRAIPPMMLDLLFDYGKFEHDHRGAGVYYFNKVGKEHARVALQQCKSKQIDHCLNVYLIMGSNGSIVTVGHLAKKINRN